jgi:hypothetical protein
MAFSSAGDVSDESRQRGPLLLNKRVLLNKRGANEQTEGLGVYSGYPRKSNLDFRTRSLSRANKINQLSLAERRGVVDRPALC